MMEAFGRTMGGLKPMHFPRPGRATSHGHSRLGLYIKNLNMTQFVLRRERKEPFTTDAFLATILRQGYGSLNSASLLVCMARDAYVRR